MIKSYHFSHENFFQHLQYSLKSSETTSAAEFEIIQNAEPRFSEN